MSLIFFTSARLAFIQIIKFKKMLLSDITDDKNKMIQCNNEQVSCTTTVTTNQLVNCISHIHVYLFTIKHDC